MRESRSPITWRPRSFFPLVVVFAALALGLAACRPSDTAGAGGAFADLRGTIRIDGSSTVFPITEAYAEEFQKATRGGVRITVGISGTGGGFKKFCGGELDIADASRPIRLSEIRDCQARGFEFVELPIAFDGLSVVVSPRNNFVDCLTVAELKTMWQARAQGTVTRWSQVRAGWPDRPFRLFGPAPDSGTFDYFTDAINGKEKDSRGDYVASEDDNVLVQGIANDPDALGYFGFAYYLENQDKLRPVGIDEGKGAGCVVPSQASINDGTYQPLARPIFIYAKLASLEKPAVLAFVNYYLDPQNTELIRETGYVPFPDRIYAAGQQRVAARATGTVFPGRSVEHVKVDDLYGKTPSLPQQEP